MPVVEAPPGSDARPETERSGVVIAPVVAMVVVPVCPAANVFAERFVVEAFEKVAVPVNVGDCEKTITPPVPVSSVMMAASSLERSIEVEARPVALIVVFPAPENEMYAPAVSAPCLPLNVAKSADERRPAGVEAPAVGMVRVWVKPDEVMPHPPAAGVEVANAWYGAVMPLSDERYASVEVDVHAVVEPFEVRN